LLLLVLAPGANPENHVAYNLYKGCGGLLVAWGWIQLYGVSMGVGGRKECFWLVYWSLFFLQHGCVKSNKTNKAQVHPP
jgi:hypothetical protein